jgi:glycosyltransferase involved in cell wall biosynthesis
MRPQFIWAELNCCPSLLSSATFNMDGSPKQFGDASTALATLPAPLGRSAVHTIHVLSLMEAKSVSGPAKNMLEFAARSLADPARRVSMSFATFLRNPATTNGFIEKAYEAGLQVRIIDEKFPFDASIIGKLRSIVRSLRPDIIQSHNFKGHFLVRLAGMHRRCRWVAFHHGYTSTNFKNQLYNQLDRWSLPAAHRVVTVCQSFAKDLSTMGVPRHRISVQHNMVKTFTATPEAETKRLRELHNIPANALVVLSVGRLSREKGFTDLVDAVGLLNPQGFARDVRWVIVGGGPEKDEIARRVRDLGIAPAFVLAGQQQRVDGYYSMADIVVIPSRSEGSPNVLLEALAAGKAVVATRVGGIPEILRSENSALLVDCSKPRELAHAILKLIDDGKLREQMSSGAPAIAKKFNPEHYFRSLSDVYARVLAED